MTGDELQDRLNSAGGAPVLMPPGEIVLPRTFSLPANSRLCGSGYWTVLRAHPESAQIAVIDAGNGGVCHLSDFAIHGGSRDQIGVLFHGVEPGSSLDRLHISHTGRSGIVIGSSYLRANGLRVAHNHLMFCGQVTISSGDFMGISVINAVDVQIADNQIMNSPVSIQLEMNPHTADALMNISVTGNLMRTDQMLPGHWAVGVFGQPDRQARWISVVGNHFQGAGVGVWMRQEYADVYQSANAVWGVTV